MDIFLQITTKGKNDSHILTNTILTYKIEIKFWLSQFLLHQEKVIRLIYWQDAHSQIKWKTFLIAENSGFIRYFCNKIEWIIWINDIFFHTFPVSRSGDFTEGKKIQIFFSGSGTTTKSRFGCSN